MTIMEQWIEYKDRAETAERRLALMERKQVEAKSQFEREKAQAERERAQAERDKAQAERDKAQAERERAHAERERVLAREREICSLLANGMNVQTVADCLKVPVALVQRLSDQQAGNASE